MNVHDQISADGLVLLTVVDGDLVVSDYEQILAGTPDPELQHRILQQLVIKNLVTNTGRSEMVARAIDGTTARPSHFAVGTTAITPAATDTTLVGQLLRKALTTTAVLGSYYQRYAVTFTAGDFNDTVRGIALFTAATGGNMWTIASTNLRKTGSQSLVAEWRIQILSA